MNTIFINATKIRRNQMDTKKWNTLVNESMAAYDMSGIIQSADDWFKQGFEYWKACGEIASSYAAPQTWLETAGGAAKTMENYFKDWTEGYGWGRNTALEEDLAAHKRQAIKTEAALQKIKKEKATLKRTLTLKEKTLKAKGTELDQHKKDLREKKKEIQTLKSSLTLTEKTLKAQGTELDQHKIDMRGNQKEIQTLKRSLTLTEKTLKARGAELEQNQKRLREKEKEIQTLQAKVKVQSERLVSLEAAGKKVAKPAAPSKAGAAVPKSGKQI
jgi:DNA repair exonuclease SbcCD ATPase subunit